MRKGFSLVELSIVIVILGLLIGGILAGKSLIRASELKSVGVDYQRYVTAVHTFRDKYFAAPGDMSNATAVWGAAPVTCPGNNSQPSTDATTCNGDNDGVMETYAGAGLGNEYFRFWQHLANAGLIEGQYAGVQGPSAAIHAVRGFNTPAAKFNSGCWSVNYTGCLVTSGSLFDGCYGTTLIIGRESSGGSCKSGLATGADIWNIDTKLDDGKPATGRVRPYYRASCSSATSSADTNATYDVSGSQEGCSIMFGNIL